MPLESSAGQMKPSRTLYPVIAQFISDTTHVSEQRNVINDAKRSGKTIDFSA